MLQMRYDRFDLKLKISLKKMFLYKCFKLRFTNVSVKKLYKIMYKVHKVSDKQLFHCQITSFIDI